MKIFSLFKQLRSYVNDKDKSNGREDRIERYRSEKYKNLDLFDKGLIDKYDLNFYNLISPNGKIDRIPDLNIGGLSLCLFEWSVEDIENYILPDINRALNEVDAEFESGSEIVSVTFDKDDVYFLMDHHPTESMPTLDFKQIVEGWRDFLLSPPLEGLRV